MGEIGITRKEFLYEIKFWETNRIIRGYQRRNILQYQLQRIQAWAAMFCMGNPQKKTPQDIFKLYFDDYDDEYEEPEPLTEEDRKHLNEEMMAFQKELQGRRVGGGG